MTKVTKEQRAVLEGLHSGEPIQTIDNSTAQALLEAGYVREARLDPAPKKGVAVNITAKGRGVLAKSGALEEAPPAPA